MTSLLADDDNRVRKEAVKYLGRSGTAAKSALPALQKLLLDTDEEIRRESAKAILAIDKEL